MSELGHSKNVEMAKKMFLPAYLQKNVDRWQIVFYQTDPATGLRKRFRESRDLNRIADLKIRQREAEREVKEINKKLPLGYPFEPTALPIYTVIRAAELARDIKIKNSTKAESHRTYKSQFAVFADFLAKKKLEQIDVRDFSKKHVRQFIHFLRHERVWKRGKESHVGLSNKKTNDYQSSISSFFYELMGEEIIEANPFGKMKRLKAEDTERRPYDESERVEIFNYAFRNDRRLFYAMLLQFNCLIRGEALRELRFGMFDFKAGVIRLPGSIEKNNEQAIKTIPKAVIHHFLSDDFLQKYPSNWLVFGNKMMPHPTQRTIRGSFNRKFQALLSEMRDKGLLSDTAGLSFYSNKNAGITAMADALPLVAVMDQAGHKDPKTTMIYRKKPDINTALRAFEVPFFKPD